MFKITPIMKKAVGLAETASEKPVKEVAKEATEVAKTVAQPPMTGLGTDLVQSSKKAYVKPEIRVIKMEDEHHILAGSGTPNHAENPVEPIDLEDPTGKTEDITSSSYSY